MGIVVRSGMLKNLANSVCKSFNCNLKERRAVRKETRCKGDCDSPPVAERKIKGGVKGGFKNARF